MAYILDPEPGQRARSRQARPALDRVAGLMAQNIWTGPAAQRFADELTGQRQALSRGCAAAVDELRALLARTPADNPG
ncbi:hypothetical protein ACFLIM_11200 [Nonomuraea sp. M3C6]|uniref:Uncharacterized protein n=1 Tax=Nonomuraea marmarensis TaxID=3351344 RepID=A0ABW7A8T4_9ACTN